MCYFAYLVGSWILGAPTQTLSVEFWFECRLICGAVCSALGYFAVQAGWRWNLVRRLRGRRTRYRAAVSGLSTPPSRRQT